MKKAILLIILLITSLLSAQHELKKVALREGFSPHDDVSDSIETMYLRLPPLSKSPSKFHFRYRKVGQIIDIYSNDSITFKGSVLNKIIRLKQGKINGNNTSVPEYYIYETVAIDEHDASEIGRLIIKEEMYNIPTDKLLKDWKFNFFDCRGIDFKYKVGDSLFKVHYGCPTGQDTLADLKIKKILNLQNRIDITLHLSESYTAFDKRLERGKWYTNEFYYSMYKLNDKESQSWDKYKPVRDYLASVKDTVDSYIKEQLNDIYVKDDIDCFDDYLLEFSKEGKLKSIKTRDPFFERLFDKEYHQCKRKIKRLFRNINLEHLKLKYEFTREVSFYNNNVTLRDPNIY